MQKLACAALALALAISGRCLAQDGSLAADDVFGPEMIGQTWALRNALGDLTRIDVQPSPTPDCAVLAFTKSAARAYWSPGSAGAKIQFEICRDRDGGWYSTRSIMSGDSDAGGNAAPWRSTSNVGVVPGMPRAYQVIPPTAGFKTSALVSKFRNYNLQETLTFSDIAGDPRASVADVTWETRTIVAQGCIAFRGYCGDILEATYLEHCERPDDLSGGCIRERWRFARGLGLVSIEVLSASTTWDGLCTRAGARVNRCYTFEQIKALRTEIEE